MNNFSAQLKRNAALVDEKITNFFAKKNYASSQLKNALIYATTNGGKKIRSFILYFIGSNLGINKDILIHIGSCLELIHTYTLVHDDLPALDNDDFRRGKPSLHKEYNEATAILVGDALQSEAFYWLSHSSLQITAQQKIAVIHTVANFSGGDTLISGQDLDLSFNLDNLQNDALARILNIFLLKTAKMIALPVVIAGILGGFKQKELNYMQEFGEQLGLLFQVLDDLDDYTTCEDTNIVNILGLPGSQELVQKLSLKIDTIITKIDKPFLQLHHIKNVLLKKDDV